MKFFALTLSLLLVNDANAVKLTQKSAIKQLGDPQEEEAKLDATKEELDDIAAKVDAGELTQDEAQRVGAGLVNQVK